MLQGWSRLVDPFESLGEVHTSYLICATPRSGSSVLCEALINTLLAGRPWEYFFDGHEPGWYEHWQVSTYEDYLNRAIEQGTTPNGVCGAKVMMGYLGDFLAKVRATPRFAGQDLADAELLSHLFANLRYIRMTRRDRVRQAVSFEKAIQTGAWASAMEPSRKAEYDSAAIERCLRDITRQEEGWDAYFASISVSPIEVIYEDFAADYDGTVRRLLDELGIAYPADIVLEKPMMKKQADAQSERWIRRFLEEKETAAASIRDLTTP